MQINNMTKFKIPQLNEFDFQIKYSETDRKQHWHEIDLHIHNEFELYINLSGDVSFLVGEKLYNLTRGDVIVARPGEYHHCVYRSDAEHRFFWILFDCNKNSNILDFMQDGFYQNYISPKDELREELINMCYALNGGLLSEEEKIYDFFRIFAILKKSIEKPQAQQSKMPQELHEIINYINYHIYEEITVKDIAKALYISLSSLERKFKKTLGITPLEYIRKKKLILASQMLQSGESVLQVGSNLGYNDISYFIELFKRYFGCTPHEYKKNNT